jgi:guanylate kinase
VRPGEAAVATTDTKPGKVQRRGFLLVLSGPSGAGKGTLVDRLIAARPECVFAISSTTRPKRGIENQGVHYEFVTREEFERRHAAGYFLETAEVHGHMYGTPVVFVDQNVAKGRVVVLDVDVQGGASLRRVRPDAVSVFIMPPSIDSLRQRLLHRGADGAETVERRLQNAPGEIDQWVHYEYVVVNDDLEQATNHLVAIVDAELSRVSRTRFIS